MRCLRSFCFGHIINPNPYSLCHSISEADPESIHPPHTAATYLWKVVSYELL